MMEIIRMNESHVSQIAQLEKLCFSDAWSERSIASELTNKLSLWLVAVDGDTVAGYIGSQTVLGWADMMNLCVAPDYRRQGIGEKLTAELERQLKENDVTCLTLEVRVSNAPAIALYEKLGFRQVGKRPRYYEKPREDALILRKEWES
jgi:ribosomal-protein-alanine N-acetyltransferase